MQTAPYRRERSPKQRRTSFAPRRAGLDRPSLFSLFVLLVLLVVGGGSAYVPIFRLGAQLLGIILMATLALQPWPRRAFRADIAQLVLGLALVALFVLHLFPLYPDTWTSLPGRGLFAAGDMLMFGLPQPRSLTLDPEETVAAALFLIPAMASWLLIRRGDTGSQIWLIAWLGFLTLSFLLALVQAVSPAGSFRFYDNSHNSFPVGFFANRNHQAAAMACGLPFAGAWHRMAANSDHPSRHWRFPALGVAFVMGTLLTGSRAGTVLMAPALIGSIAIAYLPADLRHSPTARRRAFAGLVLILSVLAGLAFAIRASNAGGSLATVFSRELFGQDSRWRFWPATWEGIVTYWPWGSGLGTFPRAFEVREPASVLSPLYLNHAHNDWLEFLFEAGLPGALLVAAFLGWLVWRIIQAVRRGPDNAALPLAAGMATVTLLLHSLCDYPIRTEAIVACLGASIGLLALPKDDGEQPDRHRGRSRPKSPRWHVFVRGGLVLAAAVVLAAFSVESGIRNTYVQARQVGKMPEAWLGAQVDSQRAFDIAQSRGRFGRIATFAIRAALRSPLVERAFAAAAIASPDRAQADAMLLHAFSLSRHDPVLLSALFQRARDADDPKVEMAAAVAIYQTQANTPLIDAQLSEDLNKPRLLAQAISGFRDAPVARQRFLVAASQAVSNRTGLIKLVEALSHGTNAIRREEISPLILSLASGPRADLSAAQQIAQFFEPTSDPLAWPSTEAQRTPFALDWALSVNARIAPAPGGGRLEFSDVEDLTAPVASRRLPFSSGNYRADFAASSPTVRVRVNCDGQSWPLLSGETARVQGPCIQSGLDIIPGAKDGWIGKVSLTKQ